MDLQSLDSRKILIPVILLFLIISSVFIFRNKLKYENSEINEIFIITNKDFDNINKSNSSTLKAGNLKSTCKYAALFDSLLCPINKDNRFKIRLGLVLYTNKKNLINEIEFKRDDITKLLLIILKEKEKHQINKVDIKNKIQITINKILTEGNVDGIEIIDFTLIQIKEK